MCVIFEALAQSNTKLPFHEEQNVIGVGADWLNFCLIKSTVCKGKRYLPCMSTNVTRSLLWRLIPAMNQDKVDIAPFELRNGKIRNNMSGNWCNLIL